MKRLLLAALLLVGCTTEPKATWTVPPAPSASPTKQPVVSGLYNAGNPSPRATHRASRDGLYRGALHDITMYCPTGNRTASGKWPHRGMVATISRSIPFGTHVFIEGLGEYVVEDRIGHSSEFDIFTPSCSEADRFGRQHRRVTVVWME